MALNHDRTVHLVYVDYRGVKNPGVEIAQTDPVLATEDTIIRNIMNGEYMDKVVCVVAFNIVEGWSRDVTGDIAMECLNNLEAGTEIRRDLLDFIEAHTDYISKVPTPAALRLVAAE